jgi:hypothetical protein
MGPPHTGHLIALPSSAVASLFSLSLALHAHATLVVITIDKDGGVLWRQLVTALAVRSVLHQDIL